MTQVYVKYNPYRLETSIKVNGKDVPNDSILYKITKGKRLQEWISKFPQMLREELNTTELDLEFYGMALDWDDFEDAFEQAEKNNIIKIINKRFLASRDDEDINEKIVSVFRDLQGGPIDDFRDLKLKRAFDNINNATFPINVIATMSSGKSTLINAMLGKRLMPSKNEACTATITEILDSDQPTFSAAAYDENGQEIQRIPDLTYDIMTELNANPDICRIYAEGDIPFLDAKDMSLVLVDTPGPNNAQNQAHKNTTYRAINNDSNNLILYVLNGTQLSTNDDASLLRYIAEQIKKGGKQIRDRFLFVINKMDAFNPEEENIENVIKSAKQYLATYGIEEPQLFPCSASTALNIRTHLSNIDIDNLTRAEERQLPVAARETLAAIDKLIDYKSMHLEQYSTLSPSAQEKLNYRLSQAIKNNNIKEQALIHSGICSIESAITAYVKKYAKTKKIKDLVESFQEVLESSQVLVKAKTQVATDEKAARDCAKRAAMVKKKIEDGHEAEAFKQKIESLDPVPKIKEQAEQLSIKVQEESKKVFAYYGENITNREEAHRLVRQYANASSDAIAELTSNLESLINDEVINTGEHLLLEYQKKLAEFDEAASDTQLDFQTAELIKGALKSMRDEVSSWTSEDFAIDTVSDVGNITYEERTYYEKVGQEEEEIVVGSHEQKVGTKLVKSGSHKEKIGTRTVPNKNKKWFKFWTWLDEKYIEEDVYTTIDDYKEEDVYETVLDYKKVMRDIFQKKTEQVEKFNLELSSLVNVLLIQLRQMLDEGIGNALDYADKQIASIKQEFLRTFSQLDVLIAQKYDELEKCAADQAQKEKTLEENKKILNWIETCMAEINAILDL